MMNESKYIFGNGETDEQYNARIAENLESIKEFIDSNYKNHRRFEKHIFFRYFKRPKKKDEIDKQRLGAEMRQDTRQLFVMDAKIALNDVCSRNFIEYLDLEEAYNHGKSFDFMHYLQYNVSEEKRAQEGYQYKNAIGFKLAATYGADNEGAEMFVRFSVPEGLILDESTPEEEVQNWFDDIKEVYIEYRTKNDIGYQSESYRISSEGLQKYPPEEDLGGQDLEILKNQKARSRAEAYEMEKLEFLYSMLGEMKIVPINSTHIEP